MKQVEIADLVVGRIYHLVNKIYRQPEFDDMIFQLIKIKKQFGEINLIKDKSSNSGWGGTKDEMGIVQLDFIDSDEIYELTEKELLAWMI